MNKKTLVLGASLKPIRYSNKAIKSLKEHDIEVVAIGNRAGEVYGVEIHKGWDDDIQDVHTVTLYLSPKNQEEYINKVMGLKPERVIFNPGAENQKFEEILNSEGVTTLRACTLVLLSTGQY